MSQGAMIDRLRRNAWFYDSRQPTEVTSIDNNNQTRSVATNVASNGQINRPAAPEMSDLGRVAPRSCLTIFLLVAIAMGGANLQRGAADEESSRPTSWRVLWSMGGAFKTLNLIDVGQGEGGLVLRYFVAPDNRTWDAWKRSADEPDGMDRYFYYEAVLPAESVAWLRGFLGSLPLHKPNERRLSFHCAQHPFSFWQGALVLERNGRLHEWQFESFGCSTGRSGHADWDRFLIEVLKPITGSFDVYEHPASADEIALGRSLLEPLAVNSDVCWAAALAFSASVPPDFGAWRTALHHRDPFVRTCAMHTMTAVLPTPRARDAALVAFLATETEERPRHAALSFLLGHDEWTDRLTPAELDTLAGTLGEPAGHANAVLAALLARSGRRNGLEWFRSRLVHAEDEATVADLAPTLRSAMKVANAENLSRAEWLRVLEDPSLEWRPSSRRWEAAER